MQFTGPYEKAWMQVTVLQRKATARRNHLDSVLEDEGSDVFSRVIEAAQRNGMTLEAWLQDAVRQNENQEDDLSPDERTLQRLLETQRQSRVEAERAAATFEETLLNPSGEDVTDAESQALIDAIEDLSQQLSALKAKDPGGRGHQAQSQSQPAEPAATAPVSPQAFSESDNGSEVDNLALEEGAHTIDDLRARILALKERIVPTDAGSFAQATPHAPEVRSEPRPDTGNADYSDAEPQLGPEPGIDYDLPSHSGSDDLEARDYADDEDFAAESDFDYQEFEDELEAVEADDAAPAPDNTAFNDAMENHFAQLGEKINQLLEKADTETRSQKDEIREQLDSNLALLEDKISQLPTRDDVAILQPMAKMQVKLQEDQTRLDHNFRKLADEHVRLQRTQAESSEQSQIPALQQQISHLESSLKSMKPALSRDVASLLDLTVQKLEKSSRNNPDAVTNSALQSHLAQLEKKLKDLPAEIAQQQPNAQSLISFLPPRETLESIEHTVGRLEAIMLEQQTTLSEINIGDQSEVFKERFDGLLSRLDDTMKRFDSASLEADRRADENLHNQKAQNQSFIEQLTAQIESLERRIEETPNQQSEHAASVDAAHQQMQDDMSRIEAQLSTVMEQLGQQLSQQDSARPAGPDTSTITKAVSDAVVVPLNEALNRVERGLDARSRQTLDDLSALVKSSTTKQQPDHALHVQLSSVPDTLSVLLEKIHDLESGVDRLQARQKKLASADNKEEPRRPRFRKAAQAKAAPAKATQAKIKQVKSDIIPPRQAEPKRNIQAQTREKEADLEIGMNYIAAARRATRKSGQPPAATPSVPAAKQAAPGRGATGAAGSAATSDAESVDGIKQRAESILSRQREELKSERNPTRRKKILGVCLGLTLIVAAVALALKTYQSQQQQSDDNLATSSIPAPVELGKDSRLPKSGSLADGSSFATPPATATSQKLPDRLPGGIDRIKALGDSVFAEAKAVTKIATPVAKPKITSKASATPLERTFVAPAPAINIGPLPLRYKAVIGDADAQFEIGSRYADGFGTAPNMPKAVEWYRRAADQGLAPAQYRLGSLLEHGRGTAKNLTAAADLYKKAAEKGNTKAMYNLGVLHAQGMLGEPNFTEAAKWFRVAANAGVKDSQFNLAILHARGMGVATDLEKAYFWFAVAAKDGDPDAKTKRDALAKDLPTDAVAKIDETVANWGPDRPNKAANIVPIPEEGWIAVEIPKDAEEKLRRHAAKASDTGPIASNQAPDLLNQPDGLGSLPLAKFDESSI